MSGYLVETAGGGRVDVNYPAPEAITLDDVAHGLAHTCRFGGHTRCFYSVAEHAVLVSRKLEQAGRRDLALAGLHHDDAEAYLGDLPRPLKQLINNWQDEDGDDAPWALLERAFDYAIAQALAWRAAGEPPLWVTANFDDPTLKAADNWALLMEARELLPSRGEDWDVPTPPWPLDGADGLRPIGLPPEDARALYLARHRELTDA